MTNDYRPPRDGRPVLDDRTCHTTTRTMTMLPKNSRSARREPGMTRCGRLATNGAAPRATSARAKLPDAPLYRPGADDRAGINVLPERDLLDASTPRMASRAAIARRP